MKIGVIDFFCGCGGASLGFKNGQLDGVDVEIVMGIDNDPHSCATYERLVGAPAACLDILQLLSQPSLLDNYKREWRLNRFDKVVVVGCSPCQGFAAHRKSVAVEDYRRNLFVAFTELAAKLQPDAVLIENVPDLVSKAHWPYFERGRKNLVRAGFQVRAQIFNFATFGLPQERFRTVVVAMRNPIVFPQPKLTHNAFRTVRDAIAHLPRLKAGEISENDPMHMVSRHRPETVAILAQVPKDGGNRPIGVGPACLDRTRAKHGGYTDVYGRLAWDSPAVTITARCRTPSCGRFAHPEQDRGLSIREAALLQGFPEDAIFEGPFDDKYKQIGNAVPPLVAREFARSILSQLTSPSPATLTSLAGDIKKSVGPGFAVTINGIKRRRQVAMPA